MKDFILNILFLLSCALCILIGVYNVQSGNAPFSIVLTLGVPIVALIAYFGIIIFKIIQYFKNINHDSKK